MMLLRWDRSQVSIDKSVLIVVFFLICFHWNKEYCLLELVYWGCDCYILVINVFNGMNSCNYLKEDFGSGCFTLSGTFSFQLLELKEFQLYSSKIRFENKCWWASMSLFLNFKVRKIWILMNRGNRIDNT